MNLNTFKSLLRQHAGKNFQLKLPGGSPIPLSFHITEVGRVQKTFIDCGGVLRESTTCQLQVWVGEDVDHRIEASKAAAILDKAASFLGDESLPVEIEYEDQVISQYTIEDYQTTDAAVVLRLAHKHTDCLARELCGIPLVKDPRAAPACCGPGCC